LKNGEISPPEKTLLGHGFQEKNKRVFLVFLGLGKRVMHGHIDILWFLEFCGIW
jgi:hypothetical protein